MSSPPEVRSPIPFVDLDRQHEPLADELREAFDRSLESGDHILGAELERFEAEFADYTGVGHCVGVASGTAAIAIALRALGIGPGDEVVVPAHTYIASALGVLHAGAHPVLCDVDAATGLVDLDSAVEALGPRTAALLVVHLYGQVCDMDAVAEFTARHDLALIEDSAQAHGARWGDRPAGSFGDIAAFSFYPSKNLGAFGDGGAIVTSDRGLAERARQFRHLGQRGKGEHVVLGFNERLDTLQAAILRVKLPRLEAWNEQRRDAAAWYDERLAAEIGRLPQRDGALDVFHLYPVRIDRRDRVADRLADAGIGTGLHYHPALHEQPPLREARRVPVPNAERWASEELSLPMFAGLSEAEVAFVCDRLEAALG